MEFSEDDRLMELQSIEAIFPNSTHIDQTTFSGSIEIPIHYDSRIDIKLVSPNKNNDIGKSIVIKQDSIKYLPPIKFSFRLHEKYPYERNLDFDLNSDVLSAATLEMIRIDLEKIWEEFKDQILYYMIDHLTQECQNDLLDGLKDELSCCKDQAKFERIMTYNKMKEKEEFNLQTFNCEICLDNKKGSKSTKITPCGHTFCNICLFEFFGSSIISGDVDKIHCPNYECTKSIAKLRESNLSLDCVMSDISEFKRKIFTLPISMDIMVHIFESECDESSEVEKLLLRYQKLFIKNQFSKIKAIFPNKVVSCPRVGCEEQIFREDNDDELLVCPRCRYAFCVTCFKSWHGKYYRCKIDNDDPYSGIPVEILERWLESSENSDHRRILGYEYGSSVLKRMANKYMSDKLFKEMVNDNKGDFTKCPKCEVVTQRLDGCNKMSCPFCQTFFCNLCGEKLLRHDPYYHFKVPGEPCYGKLFEGMPGMEEEELPI